MAIAIAMTSNNGSATTFRTAEERMRMTVNMPDTPKFETWKRIGVNNHVIDFTVRQVVEGGATEFLDLTIRTIRGNGPIE
jgi:hypothetical protein